MWVLAEPEPRRHMIVAHEAEHVAAGDPRLLATAWGALLLAPWNPLVWWQLHRLRLASELDCDARVLRHGADLRGYAGLLLDVGERFGRAPLAAAFAEPRSVLARRLAALTARKPARRAVRAALGAALALGIVAVAGATPVPQRPSLPVLDATRVAATATAAQHTQAGPLVLKIDSAGNYFLGGKAIPECASSQRATPAGQEACRSRLVALIHAAFQAGSPDSVVIVRLHPSRLIRDGAEAMKYARSAGASTMWSKESLSESVALGEETAPEPPADVRQQGRVELAVLPAGHFEVSGVSLTRAQLVP
ncbi:MAG TPA: M56 family metallopeptidase, partial [Longimicrobiales bacterium]